MLTYADACAPYINALRLLSKQSLPRAQRYQLGMKTVPILLLTQYLIYYCAGILLAGERDQKLFEKGVSRKGKGIHHEKTSHIFRKCAPYFNALRPRRYAYVSIRQHASAYVSIRTKVRSLLQHTSQIC